MFNLSVVIPCKNEGEDITILLDDLCNQRWIRIKDIIVADCSTDNTKSIIDLHFKRDSFQGINCKIVQGGLPAEGRNKGFSLVSDSEYVVFIDADMRIKNGFLLHDLIQKMEDKELDLTSCRVRSFDGKFNWLYRLKDLSHIITGWSSPFAIGGFMLFRSESFSSLGMFDEEIVYAEDYYLSKEVDPKKFSIPFWAIVYTSSRRFSKKKPIWMIKMAIRSFLNRNNKEFFMRDWGYWD